MTAAIRQIPVLLGLCLIFSQARAATYYASPSGTDAPGGGSTGAPWRTIYYSLQQMSPGDTLYLVPGVPFVESVYIAPSRAGAPGAPNTITSDPNNPAVINPPSGGGYVFYVYNATYLRFENLRIDSWSVANNNNAGMSFYADNGPPGTLHLKNVEISGFKGHGLLLGSWSGPNKGYNGITIESCKFYYNDLNGFFIYGNSKQSHRNLTIRNSTAHGSWNGSGFLINGVTTGLVEHSVAYDNGTGGDGKIGFWTYGVDGITIQYCESYNNRTLPGKNDGGGFDFDGGTVNSIMQYNYSHGNDGAGFGVYQYKGAAAAYGPLENNIIRYNLSVNDGRRGGYGAISFWGDSATDFVGPNDIYHNTIYVGGTVTSGTPSAVRFQGTRVSGLRLRNNNFIVANGFRLINTDSTTPISTAQALYQGNNWWTMPGTNFQIKDGVTIHTSLATWRTATGNERLGGVDVGTALDPRIISPGSLVAGDYRLRPDSPLIDGALDLLAAPISLGERGTLDYFGNTLPQGTNHDVGAHDRRPEVTIVASTTTASEHTGASADFTLARTGAAMKALTVPITLGGTAQAGVDYQTVPTEITLPVGQSGVPLTIVPLADDVAEGTETVRINLGASSLFDAGTPSWAEASFLDKPADDWRYERFGAQANNPAISGDNADPDGDGMPNLLEYAVGRNPLQPSAHGLPGPDLTDGRLSVRAEKNPAASDLDWSAEVSGTLAPGSWTGNVTVLQNTPEIFEALDNTASSGNGPRFMRLKVTRRAAP